MDGGDESRRLVQHLIELGYEDPHDAAERRRTLERRLDAGRRGAEAMIADRRVDEGIDALARLAGEAPVWAAPRRLLAQACYAAGRFDEARGHLDWLTFHGVETAPLTMLRAAVELARRKLDAALDQAAYARHLDEGIAGAHALAGDVHYRRGMLDDAEKAYRQELAHHPTNAAALGGLAAVCLRRGDFTGAVDWALQALGQNFRMPTVHCRLGVALSGLGRPEEAVTALETAVRLRPNFAAPFWWLARIARRQHDDEKRAAEYERRGRACLQARRPRRPACGH